MQHPNQEALRQASELIQATRDQVNDLLKPELPVIALGVESRLNQITGYLSGVGGLAVGVSAGANHFPTLAEAAEEAGIDIRTRKPVTASDTVPENEEVERLRAQVEALSAQFPEKTDDEILRGLNTPEGTKTLRGVAKLAGLEDFREAEINVVFLARIREALEKQALVNAQKEALRLEDESGATDEGNTDAVVITNPDAVTESTPVADAKTSSRKK